MLIFKTLGIGVALGAMAFVGSGTAFGHKNPTNQAQAAANSPVMDATFAKNAARGGVAEVKLGELAQRNGSSRDVKEFGRRMETDHSKADDQLKDIASRNNITLPTEMNKKDEATYDRLSKLTGPEFDREYAHEMVMDHQKDIAQFQKEAQNGSNPDVKKFASETLPTLEDHLKQAREMESTVGARNVTVDKNGSPAQ